MDGCAIKLTCRWKLQEDGENSATAKCLAWFLFVGKCSLNGSGAPGCNSQHIPVNLMWVCVKVLKRRSPKV